MPEGSVDQRPAGNSRLAKVLMKRFRLLSPRAGSRARMGSMNVERSIGRHRIGGWEFSPATGELRRRADVRRLEPRAAKALELLCEANGEVVSQEQLIAGVWSGRSLSENSVAVVIGQLRRALDDDAREPRLIETIPKRGYRLRTAIDETEGRPTRRSFAIALIAAIVLLLGVAVAYALSGRTGTPIAV